MAAENGTVRLTSDGERTRRLSALRDAMSREGLDALVVCGRGDPRFRGRVQYVSDVFQLTAEAFVVVPTEGAPVFVGSQVVGLGQAQLTDWVKDFRLGVSPGDEIARILGEHGHATNGIGIVGMSDAISAIHLDQLERALPDAQLTDATELFETVRQVKSEEELANLRETSSIFRKVFGALEAEIVPGAKEAHVAAEAARLAKLHGCKDVKVAMGTTPFRSVSYGSNKRIDDDDLFMFWLESPGPSGYWLELRRCYSFGPPPPDVLDYWNLQVECWNVALEAMVPGRRAAEVMDRVEKVLVDAGYGRGDAPYTIHGIGADAIEGMWVPGKDRVLKENEVVSLHPIVTFPDEAVAERLRLIGMTDNVLVTREGGRRMTYDTDRIVEL